MSWVCEHPAAIVPKVEAKGASLSSFLNYYLLTTCSGGYPTTPITPLRAKLLLSFPTLPARQEGPGLPFPSQVASSRLPKTACQSLVTRSQWGGILRMHMQTIRT